MAQYRSNPLVDNVVLIGAIVFGGLFLIGRMSGNGSQAINQFLYPGLTYTAQGQPDVAQWTGGLASNTRPGKPWYCYTPPGPWSLLNVPFFSSACQ